MGSKSQDICDPNPAPSDPPPSGISAVSTLSLPKHFKRNNRNHFRSNIKLSEQIGTQRSYKKMVTHARSPSTSAANNMRRSRQSSVAIATQVLNPSSLKGSRITKRFGPRDDDEEGFFTYQQRRAAWKRLCYYGISVAATIMILLAFVLAVGYFQSEKQRKASVTRSVKLVQERRPLSYVYTSTPPPSLELEPTDSHEYFPTTHSSYFLSSKEIGGLESREHYYPGETGKSEKNGGSVEDDYIVNYDLEDFDVKMKEDEEDIASKDNGNVIELEKPQPDHPVNGTHSTSTINEEEDENNNTKASHNEQERDSLLTSIVQVNEGDLQDDTILKGNENTFVPLEEEEVKVSAQPTPPPPSPQDSFFSIEIPIYKPNKTISSDQEMNGDQRENREDKESIDESKSNDEEVIKGNHDKVHELPLIVTEVSGQIKNKDSVELDDDSGRLSIKSNQSNENGDENRIDPPVVHQDHHEDQDKFHESILHTVLFQAEDEDESQKGYDRFEDRQREIKAPLVPDTKLENFPEEKIPFKKLSRNRGRGRSRKIKIMRNETMMNFKASYAPPPHKKDLEKDTVKELNEKIDLDENDFGNIKDFVMKPYRHQDHDHHPRRPRPQASSTSSPTTTSASLDSEEKPRSLSSPPSSFASNLEAFLRSILTSSGKLNLHANTNTLAEQSNRKTPELQIPDYGSTLTSNVNQLYTSSSSLPHYPGLDLDSSHLSKRTFNSEHDYLKYNLPQLTTSPSTASENYFDHLLGFNPAIGSIGSPSATGATLNHFYPTTTNYFPITSSPPPQQQQHQHQLFDISSSGTDEVPRLAPGVVPLDLASSYIPSALSLSKSRLSSASSNAPQFDAPFALNNPGGNGNVNPFLFHNNNDGNVGTLTTLAGQPPTYNTISQGIHLLNMISGVVPSTYFHDQVYPQSTTEALNPTPPYLGSLSSVSHQNHHHHHHEPLHNTHADLSFTAASSPSSKSSSTQAPFSYHPRVNVNFKNDDDDREAENDQSAYYSRPRYSYIPTKHRDDSYSSLEESDQLPAASSSFSQSILTTFKKPPPTTKPTKHTTPLPVPALMGSVLPWRSQTEPKSYTMEILPGRRNNKLGNGAPTGNIIDDTLNGLSADIIHSSLDTFVSGSKSKKKSGANMNMTEKKDLRNVKEEPKERRQRTGKVLKLKGYEFGASRTKTGNFNEVVHTKVSFSNSKANWPQKNKKSYSKEVGSGLQSGFYKV